MAESEQKTGNGQGIENAYYNCLDWLDSHGLPVYAIIDPIDRIVPSLWVWFVLVIAVLAFALVGTQQGTNVQNAVVFLDSDGSPLQGVSVELNSNNQILSLLSDAEGTVSFELPTGSVLLLKASKTGFNPYQKTLVVGKEGLRETVTLASLEEQKSFSIQFVENGNAVIAGKQIAFSLSCSNSLVRPEQTGFLVDSEEMITVSQPKECGSLVVTVNSPAEYQSGPYPVSVSNSLVQLQPAGNEPETRNGKLAVFLTTEKPEELKKSRARIALFRENRFETEAPFLGGVVHLEGLLPGMYSLLVLDENQQFGTVRKENVWIEAGNETTETITVSFSLSFSLQATVLNESDDSVVENAVVRIVDSDTGAVLGSGRTDASGIARFSFSDSFPTESVVFAVSAPGFFGSEAPMEENNPTVIRLKPAAGNEEGKVEVTVVDSSNQPVSNARVFLLDASTKQVKQEIPFQATDSTGKAFFSAVPSGNWIAWAEKGFDNGESEPFESDSSKNSQARIVIEGKEAVILVKAADETGSPAGQANVSVFAANGNNFEETQHFSLDEEGSGTVSLKTSQRVFLEIHQNGFLTYRSEILSLFSGQFLEINAVLKKDDGSSAVRIELTGFVDASNNATSRFEPGELYAADFDVTVPGNGSTRFQQVGAMVRVEEENGKTGIVSIASAQAGNADIVLGKNWNRLDGEEQDLAFENLATENASWARVVFTNPSSGVYRVRAWFRTSEKTLPGTGLLLHYNAWSVQADSRELSLTPQDSEALNGMKQSLYAESFSEKIVLSSPADECSETICFQNVRVKDLSTQEGLESPFQLLNGREYELSLELVNNSGNALSDVSFFMENQQAGQVVGLLQIQGFSLLLPEGESIQQNVNGFETSPVSFGLGIGKSALLKTRLKMVSEQWSDISLQLRLSSGEEIEKTVSFESAGSQQFSVQVFPEAILPQQETRMRVIVQEKTTQEPVKGAGVSVQLVSLDGETTEWNDETDSSGETGFAIPAAETGSVVNIQVQADGFETVQIQKTVGFLLECVPSELQTSFATSSDSDSFSVLVFNNSSDDFEAQQPALNASMTGILDEEALQNSFSAWTGTTIPESENQTFLFEAKASPFFAPASETDFQATILMPFLNTETQQPFFCQPNPILTVHASPQQQTGATQSCVTLSSNEWKSSLEHNQAEMKEPPLEILNECVSGNGQAQRFEFLQARIEWESENIGNIDVALSSEALSEQPKPQTLKANEWVTIASPFLEGIPYHAVFSFIPKENSLGKTASFRIIFAGKNGKNRVESVPLQATILVANIQDCLVFQPKPQEGIEMEINGQTSFSIDASLCGNLSLKAVLCDQDPGCGGGASRGKLEVPINPVELKNGPVEISVKPKTDDKLPGMYGIGIGIQAPESGETVIPITTMKAVVHNYSGKHFALNKFEFYLKNGKDSAVLTNSYLSERVSVQAKASDWAKIPGPSEGGTNGTQAAGSGTDPAAIDNLEEPLQQARSQTQLLASQTADALDNARNLTDQALGKQNDASQQTDQAKEAIGQSLGLVDTGTSMAQMLTTNCTPLTTCAAGLTPCPTAHTDAAKICASAQSLFSGITQSVGGPLQAAQQAIQKAVGNMGKALVGGGGGAPMVGPPAPSGASEEKAIVPVLASFMGPNQQIQQKYSVVNVLFLQAGGTAVGSAQSAQTQINQGRSDAAVESSANISTGAATGSQQANASCMSSNQAAQQDKQAQQNSSQGGQGIQQAGTGVGMNATQTGMFEAAINSASCLRLNCGPELEQMRTTFYGFKAAQTGLQSGEASVDAVGQKNDDAKDGQQQAEMASTGAGTAACAASEKLREFANATGTVSDDIGGASGEIQQDLATAGPGQGLTDGMNNGIYENEWVTNTIGGYLINLMNDATSVNVMDSVPVTGKFNTSNARVLGHFDEQEAGIEFENNGLDESKPSYATVEVHATSRAYPETLVVPEGEQDWGIYNLESLVRESEQDYYEEFHLKFNPTEKTEIGEPKETTATSCVAGALIGETGESALPRIKLSWEWNDIPIDACEPSNPDYFYCDATQFSIMVSKRVRALENFVTMNPNLPCPENVYQTQLDSEMQPFNQYLPAAGGGTYRAADFVPHCWLPESTELFEGKPALYWYVKDALDKGESIHWTSEIHSLEDLDNMAQFESHLIQDGYTEDFFKDFADYYTHTNFSDTPSFFYLDAQGKNYNQYFLDAENKRIEIKDRFSTSSQLPTSGLYQVELNLEFGEGEGLYDRQWVLFDSKNKPNGKISVQLLAKQQTESSNPFYYIPFDGAVGLENNALKRDGYGTEFKVNQKDVFSVSRETKTRTLPSQGSNAVQTLSINRNSSLSELNSRSSQRGRILDIESLSNNQKTLSFTPSLATPILLRITQSETATEPFARFFSLRQGNNFEITGENLNYWSAVGSSCKDFDGSALEKKWNQNPDRKATQEDRKDMENWENAYALDWENATRTGSVFLKTVFFVPTEQKFTLQAESNGMEFNTPDQSAKDSVDLKGISTMPFNRSGETESDKITALDDLFDLVKQEAICISNSGSKTVYWWNPNVLYQQTGQSEESIQSLEQKAENACIR